MPLVKSPPSTAAPIAGTESLSPEAASCEAARRLAERPDAVKQLVEALATEAGARVRQALLDSLIDLGSTEAAEGLAGLLASDDAGLRNAAIESLQRLGSAAHPAIERLIEASDPDLRIFAINVVEGLCADTLRFRLRDVLCGDPDVNVCLAAAEVLAQSGGPEDVPALRVFAARFTDESCVGRTVELVCRRLAGATP